MNARHLQYESIADWMAGEKVPEGFVSLDNEELRDRYITEYGELRRHLFAQHAATLSPEDQRKLKEGTHPSQSHSFAADAEPFRQLLSDYLRSRGIVPDEIVLGWYHMDRIVLTVYFDSSHIPDRTQLPWLFQGFEVFYISRASEENRDTTGD